MEQRQLPIVLFVMALFLLAGLTIIEIDHAYFNIPRMLDAFQNWLQWKTMPGW